MGVRDEPAAARISDVPAPLQEALEHRDRLSRARRGADQNEEHGHPRALLPVPRRAGSVQCMEKTRHADGVQAVRHRTGVGCGTCGAQADVAKNPWQKRGFTETWESLTGGKSFLLRC